MSDSAERRSSNVMEDAVYRGSVEKLPDLPETFLKKIEIGEDGCWNWIAFRTKNGRPVYRPPGSKKQMGARLFAYQHVFNVTLAPRMGIVAKCRNQACVNPHHMEALHPRQSAVRAGAGLGEGYCRRGHKLSGDNVYIVPSTGKRTCRKCQALRALPTLSPELEGGMVRYLSLREFAEHAGVDVSTLKDDVLPPPDARIESELGWLPSTVDAWKLRQP